MAKKSTNGDPALATADPEGIMRAALAGAMPATREPRDLLMPWAISLDDEADPAAAAAIVLAADLAGDIPPDAELPGDGAWRQAVRDLLHEVVRHDPSHKVAGRRRGGRRRRQQANN